MMDGKFQYDNNLKKIAEVKKILLAIKEMYSLKWSVAICESNRIYMIYVEKILTKSFQGKSIKRS